MAEVVVVVLLGQSRKWIGEFGCKIISVLLAVAELLGVIHGLQLCWSRGYRKIVIFTDCVDAMSLFCRGCDENYPFKDVVDDARLLFHREWTITLVHTTREQIPIADQLAKFSHFMESIFCILGQPPSMSEGEVVKGN
ncbi:uncharacterized protein LOC114713165 [Neltuma alba]|uniref:uncharacterized protein LOC114713165 n=1 Tax=Neltuma alba TaxID=207710 RepID=UPI0010A3A357|nr:uncharacterized protein LOC114713165 [Prosopis alba]